MLRLLADGSVQEDYPQRVLSSETFSLEVSDSQIQSDGSVAFTGTGVPTSGQTAFVVGRLLADGQLDPQFGLPNPGFYTDATMPAINFSGRAIAVQPDGKYLVVGEVSNSTTESTSGFVSRTNADGQPDLPFGAPPDDPNEGLGAIIVDFGAPTSLRDVAVQANNKILATGGASNDGDRSLTIRLTSGGLYDSTFGNVTAEEALPSEVNGGVFGPTLGTNVGVQLNEDGRFRVAGLAVTGGEFQVLQYNAYSVISVLVATEIAAAGQPVSVQSDLDSAGYWSAALAGPVAASAITVVATQDDGSETTATTTPTPSASPSASSTPSPSASPNTPTSPSATSESTVPADTGAPILQLIVLGCGLLILGLLLQLVRLRRKP